MSTYAIGDIQGCYSSLVCLLEEIHFDKQQDQLWIAGDLVNRGPESLQTIRFLKSLGSKANIVLGNHDLHLIAIAYGAQTPKRKDTINDILNAPDRDELIDWLRQQPLLHHCPELSFIMCHAGIPPIWTLSNAIQYAKEVETCLRSDDIIHFLNNMYGDQPDTWQDNLTSYDRLRSITNYFTRMRFCNDEGQLNLADKSSASTDQEGYKPWFEHKGHLCNDQQIIFGHWAALEGTSSADFTYALDTGCVWGGKLTAMRLEDKKIFSCDCSK